MVIYSLWLSIVDGSTCLLLHSPLSASYSEEQTRKFSFVRLDAEMQKKCGYDRSCKKNCFYGITTTSTM